MKAKYRYVAAVMLIAVVAALPAVVAVGAGSSENDGTCVVCGGDLGDALIQVQYRGLRFRVCSGRCREAFERLAAAGRLDRITAAFEPRAALFQADAATKPPLSRTFLLFGLYVFSGLITGGLSAFVAIRKGLGGGSAFVAGMALSVAGLAVTLARAKGETAAVPKGHTRALKTRPGTTCPSCGEPAHPDASRCPRCGSALTPAGPSEASLALGNTPRE